MKMTMTTSTLVKMAMAYKRVSVAELARRLGTTREALRQRLSRETLKPQDLEKIAEVLGAEFVMTFRFPDGKEI